MSHTPAYTVIKHRRQINLLTSGMYLSIRICRGKKGLPSLSGRSGTRIISNAADLLSGQVFPRMALPWRNVCAEFYADIC